MKFMLDLFLFVRTSELDFGQKSVAGVMLMVFALDVRLVIF